MYDWHSVAYNVQNFNLSDQKYRFEIAKLCAQKRTGQVIECIEKFNITDQGFLLEIGPGHGNSVVPEHERTHALWSPAKECGWHFVARADRETADAGRKGFVYRHYQPTIPPAVTYGITDRMKDIEKVLAQLEGLARKWQGEGAGAKSMAHATSAHD